MLTRIKEPIAKPLLISGIFERSPFQLVPNKNNARAHSPAQITALAAAINAYGFTSTILVDEDGVILSGHARVMAAKQLNLDIVPVRIITGLTAAQKRAYVLSDNKMGLLSSWDIDQLAAELDWLSDIDYPTELTGFSTAEIDELINPEVSAAEQASDPAELIIADLMVPKCAILGDLFLLDKHRVLCGDARNPQAYAHLMNGVKAQMIFCDPPYNVKVAGHVCGKGRIKHSEFKVASGELTQIEFTQFLGETLSQMAAFSLDGSIHFVCMDWRHQRELLDATLVIYGQPKQMCVWKKDNGGMGSFYRSKHELIYVFKQGTAPHINNFKLGQFGRYRTNVWEYAGANSFRGNGKQLLALHPTCKPVAMVMDAIKDCSNVGGVIADPFLGSGTVVLAAERTKRVGYGMDLEGHYIDVTIARWQRVSGQVAIHAETGLDWQTLGEIRRQQGLLGGAK